MAVIQKDIVVPDSLLPGVMSGAIDIMGLAKNSDNGQIIKHLPAADSNDSDSSAVAATTLFALCLAATAAIGYGVYTIVNKAKVKHFKDALNTYVEAVNNKELTVEIIDNLVAALDKLKGKLRKRIQIEFSNDELSALVECLCNHTQTLADANSINLKYIPTEEEQSDILLRFHNNLVKQRSIFELAS